jgi:hypothetical protein
MSALPADVRGALIQALARVLVADLQKDADDEPSQEEASTPVEVSRG